MADLLIRVDDALTVMLDGLRAQHAALVMAPDSQESSFHTPIACCVCSEEISVRLKKLEREQVRMKYGGRCTYCGIELGGRWHADHLEPVTRELIPKQNANGTWRLDAGKPLRPENDHIGNMMPACAPCNISKGSQSLEVWRTWIARHVNSLNLYHPIYRLAKAYGLVVETAAPVVFYFETVTL
ncbi:HNH endonuclease [Pseudomonas graminis]|uniref:HNH endonuclease n=1 Tax=Pseudomonas graminis TaxID=158627 RepID=UPI0020B16A14|nr:HNH endonuclease [Pseudomonas graminis]